MRRKNLYSRIAAVVMCVTMSAALVVGCGSGTDSDGGKDSGKSDKGGDEKVQTVEILTQFGEAGKKAGLEAISKEVEKEHPEYKFEIICLSYDKYVERLKQEMSAGDPPSIFTGRPKEFPEFVEVGQVLDLTDYDFINDFDEKLREEVTKDGKVWSVPYDKEIYGVFYRQELLDEYNLEIPKTKEEWSKVCDTLKENGVTPVAFGGADTDPCNYTLETFWDAALISGGNTDAIQKVMDKEISIKEVPEFKAALKNAYDMLIPYIEVNDMSITRDTAYENFCSLDRAFTIHGNFCASILREGAPDGDIGIFPIPWGDDPQAGKLRYGVDDAMMIAAEGNTEAAIAWMEYATSTDGLSIWADNSKSYSASKLVGEIENTDPINQDINKYFDAGEYYFKGDLKYFDGSYLSEWQNMAQKFFSDGLEAYGKGQDSEEFVTSFLDEVDSRFSAF